MSRVTSVEQKSYFFHLAKPFMHFFFLIPGFISRTGSKSAALVQQDNLVGFIMLYNCKDSPRFAVSYRVHIIFSYLFRAKQHFVVTVVFKMLPFFCKQNLKKV